MSIIKIEPAALRALLSSNSLFAKLSDEQLLSLADIVSEVRQLSAGQYLVHEGDEARELFIVEEGELEVMTRARRARRSSAPPGDPAARHEHINMAYEMGRRLRATNETTVKTLREKLDEAEKRAEMGKFMARAPVEN